MGDVFIILLPYPIRLHINQNNDFTMSIIKKILTNYCPPDCEEFDIVCFSGKHHDLRHYYKHEHQHFSDIIDSLPFDWKPDIVIFKAPFEKPIPLGIENSPYPTAVILDDWYGAGDYLPDNLRRFDYIFTDKSSMKLLKNMGFDNVDYWPAFGYNPSQFRIIPKCDRTIDLFFAGSMNINIQSERLYWLRKLCSISNKYLVKINHNTFQEDYVLALNCSKIVFNRSIKGEMNMRAFEIPACGSLLFMEEENLEIGDFLTDGKECILYNNDNLEELIDYYLKHEEERKRIASAGYIKIQQFSYPKLFTRLLEVIAQKNITTETRIKTTLTYASSTEHRDFVQSSLSINGRAPEYLPKTLSFLQNNSYTHHFSNDCAIIIASIAFNIIDFSSQMNNEFNLLISQADTLLHKLYELDPLHITALFNRAQICFETKQYTKASLYYQKIISSEWSVSTTNVKGIAFPLHYKTPLRYLWSKAVLDNINNENNFKIERINTITGFAAHNLSKIYQKKSLTKAIVYSNKANHHLPEQPFILNQLCSLSSQAPDESTLNISLEAIRKNPFNTSLWSIYINNLKKNNEYTKVNKFIDDCLLCLNRVQFSTNDLIKEFKKSRPDDK